MTAQGELEVGDRVQFDGKRTSWKVRAFACDGRYALATAGMFGKVLYTVMDSDEGIRGPLNVVGQGMGIFTLDGPDENIDEAIAMLEGRYPEEIANGHWGVSHRNRVPLIISRVLGAS